MIDWLRRKPASLAPATPAPTAHRTLVVAGRELPLRIRKLHNARRITLRLAPDGSEARVTLPRWGRIGEAEAFARERSDWLADQIAALPAPVAIVPGGLLPYRGDRLEITWAAGASRKPVAGEGAILLGGPPGAVEARLRRWLEDEALRLFAADVADYAPDAGVPIPPVRLTRARRRWGSCTADGTVRLNWRLVMAPDFVRRSVVAHEIAHLIHFDHSPNFHDLLEDLFEGEVAAANRWLKRHGRSLYAVFA